MGSTNWNNSLFHDMVMYASRAPSVHNVQPWKIKFTSEGFILFQSKKRRLHVGDPRLHDNDVSLGAFVETCAIFLSSKNLKIQIENIQDPKTYSVSGEKCEERFLIKVSTDTLTKDAFFDYVEKRKSFRGIFDPNSPIDRADLESLNTNDLKVVYIDKKEELKKLAKTYDKSSTQILKEEGYFEELRHWMRFTPQDPLYNTDGLNAESLALNSIEAKLAEHFFKPGVFKFLANLGLGELLVTEAPQINSSSAVALVYVNKNLSSLEAGRLLMRYWLGLTVKKVYICPLSALVDFTGNTQFLTQHSPDSDMICLNAFRIGFVKDEGKINISPRLDPRSIIIS